MERRAYIRSLTQRDTVSLEGQVPETKVSGETADISPWALFDWYEWVMFRDTGVSDPADKWVLGRDLGPSIDVGPAMSRKVLKANGQVMNRSSVRSLTQEEIHSPVHIKLREEFDKSVHEKLGEGFRPEDIDDPDMETPYY
jgi:hypothetical protein